MLTLGQIRPILWNYGSNVPYATASSDQKAAFDANLNQVLERFLRAGYSTTEAVLLSMFTDNYGNTFVTLPRQFISVLGGVSNYCYGPLTVRGDWYEYLPHAYRGLCANPGGIVAMPGRFTTFQDWNTPMRLRVKLEKDESSTFLFRGNFQGDKIYTNNSGTWQEGVTLAYTSGSATTTQLFDEPPYQVVKPVTQGRVTLWTVDTSNVETQVAEYDPQDTVPAFRRYKLASGSGSAILSSSSSDLPTNVYSKTDVDNMFGSGSTITVSTSNTIDLAPASPFVQWFQRIIAAAGSVSYTHNFTLDTSQAKDGAIFRVAVEVAQSSNPHIVFYNDTTSGTMLDNAAVGDTSNAGIYFVEFEFNKGEGFWRKIKGEWLTT